MWHSQLLLRQAHLNLLHIPHAAPILERPPHRKIMEIMRPLELLRRPPQRLQLVLRQPPKPLALHLRHRIVLDVPLPEGMVERGHRRVLAELLQVGVVAGAGFGRDEHVGGEEVGVFTAVACPGDTCEVNGEGRDSKGRGPTFAR